MKTSRPAWSQPSARPTRSPPRCGPLDGLYAAFVFSRDLGRFIRPGMSEAHSASSRSGLTLALVGPSASHSGDDCRVASAPKQRIKKKLAGAGHFPTR